MPPISAGPAAKKQALVGIFWDAMLSYLVAALSVRSLYCAAVRRHGSRTVAVATPRPMSSDAEQESTIAARGF